MMEYFIVKINTIHFIFSLFSLYICVYFYLYACVCVCVSNSYEYLNVALITNPLDNWMYLIIIVKIIRKWSSNGISVKVQFSVYLSLCARLISIKFLVKHCNSLKILAL